MEHLRFGGWLEPLERAVRNQQKPFLGLCLGMQLLATESEENGLTMGLDWIAGSVKKLSPRASEARVPHVGWNDVTYKKRPGPFRECSEEPVYYFVHSFAFEPKTDDCVVATCDYFGDFVACIATENIFATQFHPEKSQKEGLLILRTFAELV